jgi:hypothetical protein
MNRSCVAAAAAIFLAACGGSSNNNAPAAPSSTPMSGTLFGQPFVLADSSAITPGAGSCSLSAVTASVTGLAVRFSSFPGVCSLMTSQNRTCGSRANTTVLTVVLVDATRGGAAAPIQPGAYAITASLPIPENQSVVVAQAFAAKTGDCSGTPSASYATSGTVTITSVGSTVTGSLDVTFADGGRVSGSFSASTCGVQVDVCSLLTDLAVSCIDQTCVP